MNNINSIAFADLYEVFPTIKDTRAPWLPSRPKPPSPSPSNPPPSPSNPPPSNPPPSYNLITEANQDMNVFKNFKEFQKLCNIDGKICIESRYSIHRWLNDSRWTVLYDLDALLSELSTKRQQVSDVLRCIQQMIDTTYKNDKKWTVRAQKLIDKYKKCKQM